VRLLYAVAFALFPLAAPAQTLDPPTLAAVCNDDHCDDSGNQGLTISAGDVLSIEAILEKYGAAFVRDTDDELAGVFTSDPESLSVGSINHAAIPSRRTCHLAGGRLWRRAYQRAGHDRFSHRLTRTAT